MYLVSIEYGSPFEDRTHIAGHYETKAEALVKFDDVNDRDLAFHVRTRIIYLNPNHDVEVVTDYERANTVYWYARDWFGADTANQIPEPFSDYDLDSNQGYAVRENIDELLKTHTRDGAASAFIESVYDAMEEL